MTTNRKKCILNGFLFLIILVLCQGCRAFEPIERFKASTDPYRGSSYKAVLMDWTREARIYKGFDVELIAAATYKSSLFRNAYSNEYARAYKLTEAEKKKLIKDQEDAFAIYNDFVVTAYVPDKKHNDFGKKDSVWKIYLTIGEKDRIKPVEIRKIKKIDARISHFFPYINIWKSVYLVRFPVKFPGTEKIILNDSISSIKLVITSVTGSAEMEWDL